TSPSSSAKKKKTSAASFLLFLRSNFFLLRWSFSRSVRFFFFFFFRWGHFSRGRKTSILRPCRLGRLHGVPVLPLFRWEESILRNVRWVHECAPGLECYAGIS